MDELTSIPLVSVIVPVYNSSAFVVRCATSLFSQTLKDIEFIFVDDASTDDSVSLIRSAIDKFPGVRSKVRIICESQNHGQAAGFKKALELSRGEYIIKCDSDDEVEPTMYEEMYSCAKESNHDVVICDIKFIYPQGNTNRFWGRIEGFDDIESILGNRIPTSLCNRLVKRELFFTDGFKYPECNMCEDFVYSIQLAYLSRSTGYLKQQFYWYYRHPASFTWNGSLEAVLSKHEQIVRNVSLGLAFLEEKGLSHRYKGDIIRQCLFVKNGLKNHLDKEGIYSQWKNTFKDVNPRILFCNKIPIKERMIFLMIYCHVYGTYKAIKRRIR